LFSHAQGLDSVEVSNQLLDVQAEIKKGGDTFNNFFDYPVRDYFNVSSETYAELLLGVSVSLMEAISSFGSQLLVTVKILFLSALRPYSSISAAVATIQSTL
jgi:hypothetical protein